MNNRTSFPQRPQFSRKPFLDRQRASNTQSVDQPQPNQFRKNPKDTSWQSVDRWYNAEVGDEGHYYHQHVVLPNALRLLDLRADSTLLDLGCGQGVLARAIPQIKQYVGIDLAPGLIQAAKKRNEEHWASFEIGDMTKRLPVEKNDFSHAAIVLALQNTEKQAEAIQQAATHLRPGGKLLIVLNHPCFRIPRQSSWGVDEGKKTQYRRIDRYLSSLSIPINMHPGQKGSAVTWSYHRPIGWYVSALFSAGLHIEQLEEWTSDKTSQGKAARMENRGRSEFPLFLAMLAVKT